MHSFRLGKQLLLPWHPVQNLGTVAKVYTTCLSPISDGLRSHLCLRLLDSAVSPERKRFLNRVYSIGDSNKLK